MKIYVIPFLAFLGLTSGCASYHVGSIHDPGFKTIFIENFKSDVDEPGLENLVTTTVIKEFQRDGTIEVTSADLADVILRGRITSYELSPVRFSRSDEITPIETSLTIGVHYTLTKRNQTKPFVESQASGNRSFFIGNDLQSDKRQGVPLAAEVLARQIVANLADGW